ncbi:MAG TPA: hypothetical protein VN775_06510 [Opitutaceae bacterium]|nr:hypothetical protein [Opitutaceae bacterium]
MKSQIIGLKVASVLFMLVALAHAARLVFGWKVQIGEHAFGLLPSVVALLVAGGLSVWLGTLACGCKTDAASPPSAAPKA